MLTPSLDSKHLAKPAANKYGPYSEIQSLGVNERGYVVALLKDETTGGGKDNGAHVYRMDLNGIGLNKVGDLSPSVSGGFFLPCYLFYLLTWIGTLGISDAIYELCWWIG